MQNAIVNVGDRVVNHWLVTTPTGKHVLVDTGYAGGYPTFVKRLAAHGFAPDMIDYVFLTHAHDDHAGYLAEVLQASKAMVICHPAALDGLKRGQNNFAGGCAGRLALLFCRGMALFGKSGHAFPPLPDALLERLLVLTDESEAALNKALGARILRTPGHTACSLSLAVQGAVFCGDAAMNGFPSHGHVSIWVENLAAYAASWQVLIREGGMLYPGHGKPFPAAALQPNANAPLRRKLFPLSPPLDK